jgi:hypothetical protein
MVARRRPLVVGLVLALGLGACGLLPGGDEEPAGPAAPAPVDQPFALRGVCPDPVVIQTDWNPESEYGATYNLVGPGYRIDKQKATVRGPLVVEGRDTGIEVEVRSGGPAIEFATIASVMYKDRSITLGYMNTEQAAQFYAKEPTTAVVAPMDISPGAIMWDPATHPDWNTMVDIGQTNDKVLVTKDDIFPEYLVGSGILRESQLDDSYDGSPTKFLASKGEVAQGGFATAEPYIYQNEIPDWGKPIAFQLIHDTGFESYTQSLAIRAGDKDKLAPCLRKLVPLVQRSIVDFIQRPQRTNQLVVDLVNQYKNGWLYSKDLATFSVAQQRRLGIVGNGPDLGRVQAVLDIVRPILAGRRQPLDDELTAGDLATNEFMDPAIGLR